MVAIPQAHPLAICARIRWQDIKAERFLLSRRHSGPEIHDELIARLAAAGDRPTIDNHDVSRECILNIVGAGRGISLLHEYGTGAKYPGVIYREVHGKDGPIRVDHVAYWSHTNDNPALRRLLSLLRERYPVPSSLAAVAGCG